MTHPARTAGHSAASDKTPGGEPAARRRRVPALSPDERRAALVEATLPLLRQFGPGLSTRQIAEAAGVAEGTIFGVFPDKASLIKAACVRMLDPAETIDKVNRIDRSLELRARLERVTAILREDVAEHSALIVSLFRSGVFQPPSRGGPLDAHGHGPPREVFESRERIIDAVVGVIGSDAAALRKPPGFVANVLVSIVFMAGRGGLGFIPTADSPQEIVSLLLDGLLVRPDQTSSVLGDTTC